MAVPGVLRRQRPYQRAELDSVHVRAFVCVRLSIRLAGNFPPHTPASPTSPSKSAPGGKGYVHLSIRHLLFILRPHSRYPSLTIVVVVRVLKRNKTTPCCYFKLLAKLIRAAKYI